MVKMSSQHQMMDSHLSLGRLEMRNPKANQDSGLSGAMNEKDVQVGPQTHLNGCVPLSHQVAGHKYGVDKVGILQHPDGTVLKQLQPPPRGPREMQFYSKVYAEGSDDQLLLDLQRYLPKYYGTWASPDSPTDLYLKLEDVTRKFARPCIMDVKIGQRSYDPFASQEKREQQVKKYPLMEEIGFLVLGMRVYKVNSDTYDVHDQHYGRALGKDTVKEGIAKFFHNGNVLRKDAVAASIQKVQKILEWFEVQSQLHFYASSLLFVYEGSPQQRPEDGGPTGETALPAAGPLKGGVQECNNNICGVVPRENGLVMASLSNAFVLHQRDCGWGPRAEWKRGPLLSPERPNGNGADEPRDVVDGQRELDHPQAHVDVEVRMIDFAHVFPSNTPDEGYVYGLKKLLLVLQQILNE